LLGNNKESISSLLKACDATIKFTKKDGTERVMKCTLRENAITPYEKKTDRVKKDNDDVLSVWDLELNSWRSINVNSILTVEV
jgi:hypothetical protein